MVFQRPNPFPTMSIYENVVSGLRFNGVRKKALLDEAGVEMSADDAEGDPEAILDEFRDFLDDITPDDFAS